MVTCRVLWRHIEGTFLPWSILVDRPSFCRTCGGVPLHCPQGRTGGKEVRRDCQRAGESALHAAWTQRPAPGLGVESGVLLTPFLGPEAPPAPPTLAGPSVAFLCLPFRSFPPGRIPPVSTEDKCIQKATGT